jgi:uncharacterized membrane protein YqjE
VIHPLIRLLATRPHLLAEHLGGYAHLLSVQVDDALMLAKVRTVLLAGLAAGVVIGTGLAGVAVMLLAVIPMGQMPAPWALAVAPAIPISGAAFCWWLLQRQPQMLSFDLLRDQLSADAALLREASD